ncbi:MAG: T9SS type A sorting domain-containing protein [Fibrobacteres bacterium]|nr:T9SS type A sorting domain-containing protein [Fibrobacterota bacterium]
MKKKGFIILLGLIGQAFSIAFIESPKITSNGNGTFLVEFAVDETTDVEVSVVNTADSSIVRHLAAGRLGSKAPLPLQSGTTRQSIIWDGKDDFGNTASNPLSLKARVRAGMQPKLAGFGAEDLLNMNGALGGINLDPDGNLCVLGKTTVYPFLRKFDASGNYLKTLFPPPENLSRDSVQVSRNINLLPEGGWAPKAVITYNGYPVWDSLLTNVGDKALSPSLFPFTGANGEVLIAWGDSLYQLSQNGARVNGVSPIFKNAPARPTGTNFKQLGACFYTPSNDPNFVYLSGYYFGQFANGNTVTVVCSTGFWAEGHVYKINRSTGEISSFIALDSVPGSAASRAAKGLSQYALISSALQTAVDTQGNVYLADRLHNQIGVYDKNGTMLGAIPFASPFNVAVSKRTGYIYVVRRKWDEGSILYRYKAWPNVGTPIATTRLVYPVDASVGPSYIALAENEGKTKIWFGQGSSGVCRFRDDETKFTIEQNFPVTKYVATGGGSGVVGPFSRMMVDRKTDKLYWLNLNWYEGGGNCAWISDWNNPQGFFSSIKADEMTIGPNGAIYSEKGVATSASYSNPVSRYDQNFVAKNYSNTNTNLITPNIVFEGSNHLGLAVSWQKQVAVFDERTNLYIYPDTGYTSGNGKIVFTHDSRENASCVKFDAAGNLYVGVKYQPAGWLLTPGFESDAPLKNAGGSIIKIKPDATAAIAAKNVTGADKIYKHPFGQFPNQCTCTSPRFDVDPYGRLYIPSGSSSKVAVVDNEGNTIADFGKYGNTDSRGGSGIPIGWSGNVAASEDYIYVADLSNQRIVRVKMDYAVDNYPGLTSHTTTSEAAIEMDDGMTLRNYPNPFNPSCRLTITLPATAAVKLDIYDAIGSLVKSAANGIYTVGSHTFTFDGSKLSSGIYVAKLKSARTVKTARLMLCK